MLLSVNGIQEAVVLAVSEGGLPELCAYYKAGSELKGSELRKRLSETLPSHMLPYFVQVDRIPLTANGKPIKRPPETGRQPNGANSFSLAGNGIGGKTVPHLETDTRYGYARHRR